MAYTPQNNIERDLLWSQSKKGDMKKDGNNREEWRTKN